MYANVASVAEQCLVRACWDQWRALKGEGRVVGQRAAESIIDPEALVLASLSVRKVERRLVDILYWWAGAGAYLLSVQRLKTMRGEYAEATLDGGVAWFAAQAVDAKDARWKGLAADAAKETVRTGKGSRDLALLEPCTLMLRLRAGFGVGVKADLMAFLIGAASAAREANLWTTTRVITQAIGYSRPSVARAAVEMQLAGFISSSGDRPPTYSADRDAWAAVLGLRDPYALTSRVAEGDAGGSDRSSANPPWRFWSQLFPFLAACVDWARGSSQAPSSPVVNASRARDIVERFGRPLQWSGIQLPDARVHAGERYLVPFEALVTEVVRRVEDGV